MKNSAFKLKLFGLFASSAGLLLFTLLTLGVFTASGDQAVADVLKSGALKDAKYITVLPKEMFETSDGASFLQRFKGNVNQVYVCSISASQYNGLMALGGVKHKQVATTDRTYDIAFLDGNENSKDVFNIISLTDRRQSCVSTNTNSLFFIDSPQTISAAPAKGRRA